jgi:hypothetical protein
MQRRYKWDPIATNGTQLETGDRDPSTMIAPRMEGDSLARERESCPQAIDFVISCRGKAINTAEVGNGKKGIRPPE